MGISILGIKSVPTTTDGLISESTQGYVTPSMPLTTHKAELIKWQHIEKTLTSTINRRSFCLTTNTVGHG
jgi:hypothetical protein